MNQFRQTSSIARRLPLLGLFLLALFLADFIGTYWVTNSLVQGLQRAHSANVLYDLSSQALENLSAASETLRGTQEAPPGAPPATASLASAMRANEEQALEVLRRAREVETIGPEERQYVDAAIGAVEGFSRAAFAALPGPRARSSDRLKAGFAIASQFEIEAREPIRKLQLLLKTRSDDAFLSVYSQRNRPLVTSAALGALFLLAALLFGLPMVRRLLRSIRNLLGATNIVGSGEVGYRAPVLGADDLGKVTHAFNRMLDELRDRKLREERSEESERKRLVFLARAGEALSSTLNYDDILESLATMAVPELADWAVVDIVGADRTVHRVSRAHVNPALAPELALIESSSPNHLDAPGHAIGVIRSGKAAIHGPMTTEALRAVGMTDEYVAAIHRLGIESVLSVPIVSRGRTLGAISLIASTRARTFGERDLLVAEDLARKAASALDNARLYGDARDAVRARDEFMSIASHELRTPLTPLKLQLQNLNRAMERGERDGPLQIERVRKAVQSSDRMVTRLARLIDDLLDVSRINSGQLALRFEPFDFAEMTREVCERFRDEFDRVGVPLEVDASAPAPGTWDRTRMEQVVTNLLTNALRYGQNKPVVVRVLPPTAGQVTLEVVDQGIGISAEDQARIFQRFERASPSSHYGGLGLGLYITTQILDLHAGHIEVRSASGAGSTFVVSIPQSPPAVSAPWGPGGTSAIAAP